MWFKDDPILSTVKLPPAAPIPLPTNPTKRAIAATFNRIGGLMSAIAANAQVPVEAVLAVWQAESGSLPHVPGRPVLRFENHVFFRHWGVAHEVAFDRHFQFGGRAGVPGRTWQNHKWRQSASGP